MEEAVSRAARAAGCRSTYVPEYGVWGLGFGAWIFGVWALGLGIEVHGSEFRALGMRDQ